MQPDSFHENDIPEVDWQLSLKEVCAMAGISHQSIRMYEKWGILPKLANEENGYRFYHYPDLQRVMFLRYYAELGIPVKQTASLINGAAIDELIHVHEDCMTALEKQQQFLQAEIECLRYQRKMLENLTDYSENCQIVTRPGLYLLCCWKNGQFDASKEALALLHEWSKLRPVTFFASIMRENQIQPNGVVDPGYIIFEPYAHLLSTTDSPYISYFPPMQVIQSISRVSSKARDFYSIGQIGRAFLHKNNLTSYGDNLSFTIANKALTRAFPDDPSDYICGWLQFRKRQSV